MMYNGQITMQLEYLKSKKCKYVNMQHILPTILLIQMYVSTYVGIMCFIHIKTL